MNGTHKQIFIVITQTGTMLSRILKRITGAEYNHASLSPSQDLTTMRSFGRGDAGGHVGTAGAVFL